MPTLTRQELYDPAFSKLLRSIGCWMTKICD
jgi:hypothetical protein